MKRMRMSLLVVFLIGILIALPMAAMAANHSLGFGKFNANALIAEGWTKSGSWIIAAMNAEQANHNYVAAVTRAGPGQLVRLVGTFKKLDEQKIVAGPTRAGTITNTGRFAGAAAYLAGSHYPSYPDAYIIVETGSFAEAMTGRFSGAADNVALALASYLDLTPNTGRTVVLGRKDLRRETSDDGFSTVPTAFSSA